MFQPVPYKSALESIANAKLSSEDASVLIRTKVAVPAIKQMVQNFKTWQDMVETKQAECKKLIESVTAKVEEMRNPDWIPNIYTFGEVKGSVDIFNAVEKYLKEQNQAYSESFEKDGMRSNDLGVAIKKSFPQLTEKHVDELKLFLGQARVKTIGDNRAEIAIRTRIGEYAKRAEILVKAADMAQAKALGRMHDAKAALEKAMLAANEHAARCANGLEHVSKKLKAIDLVLTTKKDAKTAGSIKSLLAERDENMKNARGALKTMNQELELAVKVLADLPQLGREFKGPLAKLQLSWMQMKKEADQLKEKTFPENEKEITKAGFKV
jgi:hypothetical protein